MENVLRKYFIEKYFGTWSNFKSDSKSDTEIKPIYYALCLNCSLKIVYEDKPIKCFRCHNSIEIFVAKTFQDIPSNESEDDEQLS